MTLILANGRIYRPAGCRLPELYEWYVSKTGAVVQYLDPSHCPQGDRLIVRELDIRESPFEQVTPPE